MLRREGLERRFARGLRDGVLGDDGELLFATPPLLRDDDGGDDGGDDGDDDGVWIRLFPPYC